MSPAASESKVRSAQQPRVLLVDDEPELLELLGDLVSGQMDCRVLAASSLAEAKRFLADGPLEVLVTDLHLPDGDGMSLVAALHERQPNAAAIVITGKPSLERAISAIRGGVLDFVPKPFSNQQLLDRVRSALERGAVLDRREKRLDRLRDAVRKLNESRKLISKKVDLLCNDLVSAYGELSRQLDGIRSQEGFRKAIAKAKDLEQLLCHSMDWLLRQVGYCNVAVYLASDDSTFQLGAYMKYTVAGEGALTSALKRVLVPMALKEGIVHLRAADLGDRLTPQEMAYIKGHDIIAINCTYLGECLAALVFFREESGPFSEEDHSLLKQISPIFAVELASIVRDGQPSDSPFADGEGGAGTDEPNKKPGKPKKDPADWWKHGEEPPF